MAFPQWVPVVVIGGVCTFALWKGGREERLAAGAFLIGTLAAPLLKDHRWIGPQWAIFAVDGAYLLLLLAIAMRTRRYWPIWAAGFQLLGVLTHAARMIDTSLGAWAYVTAGVIWTYLGLVAIGVGTYGVWRERAHPAISGAPAAAGETRR